MSKNPQNSLIDFMKKQTAQKINKQNSATKNDAKVNNIKGKSAEDTEELSEEEKINKAKKESRGKAAAVQDKSAMYQKLFLETTAKYVLAMIMLVGVMIIIIKLIPIIGSFLNGFITKFLLSGAK